MENNIEIGIFTQHSCNEKRLRHAYLGIGSQWRGEMVALPKTEGKCHFALGMAQVNVLLLKKRRETMIEAKYNN